MASSPDDTSGPSLPRAEAAQARSQQNPQIPHAEHAGIAIDPDLVWREHRRWVAAILLAYKPRWADLDDLLQDVAMTVVRHAHELRDASAVKPWLRSVAMNAARAAARSGNVRHGYLESLRSAGQAAPPAAEAADAPTQASEAQARIVELASKLPDGYREPLLLKAVRDLSYKQIGQILNLPETTVETRIARARRMLRDLASDATPSG